MDKNIIRELYDKIRDLDCEQHSLSLSLFLAETKDPDNLLKMMCAQCYNVYPHQEDKVYDIKKLKDFFMNESQRLKNQEIQIDEKVQVNAVKKIEEKKQSMEKLANDVEEAIDFLTTIKDLVKEQLKLKSGQKNVSSFYVFEGFMEEALSQDSIKEIQDVFRKMIKFNHNEDKFFQLSSEILYEVDPLLDDEDRLIVFVQMMLLSLCDFGLFQKFANKIEIEQFVLERKSMLKNKLFNQEINSIYIRKFDTLTEDTKKGFEVISQKKSLDYNLMVKFEKIQTDLQKSKETNQQINSLQQNIEIECSNIRKILENSVKDLVQLNQQVYKEVAVCQNLPNLPPVLKTNIIIEEFLEEHHEKIKYILEEFQKNKINMHCQMSRVQEFWKKINKISIYNNQARLYLETQEGKERNISWFWMGFWGWEPWAPKTGAEAHDSFECTECLDIFGSFLEQTFEQYIL